MVMTRPFHRFSFIILVSALLLGGCIPVQYDFRPKLALLNGPTEARLDGLAQAFQAQLEPRLAGYGYSPSAAMRYQERARDMGGSRARMQAAFSASARGARYALLVGFDAHKVVTDAYIVGRELELTLRATGRLKTSIIRAEDARMFGTFSSAPFTERQRKVYPFPFDPETPEGKVQLKRLKRQALDEPLKAFSGTHFERELGLLADPVAAELTRLLDEPTPLAESR